MLEDWTTLLPPLVKNVNPAKLFMQRFKNTADLQRQHWMQLQLHLCFFVTIISVILNDAKLTELKKSDETNSSAANSLELVNSF